MSRKLLISALALALLLPLAACGKKNSPVHPDGSDFPRQYPEKMQPKQP